MLRDDGMRFAQLIVNACLLVLAGVSFVGNVEAQTQDVVAPPENLHLSFLSPAAPLRLPPQGLYETCLPSESGCLDRLTEMSNRGFRLVLNDGLRYEYTAKSIKTYADWAQKLGVKVILPIGYYPQLVGDSAFLPRKFPDLASECGCNDNTSFLTYYIGILKDHPALWGYYVADEIHPQYYSGLKAYTDLIRSLDPKHPRFVVEEGTNDPMEVFFTFHSYMKDTAEVLAPDLYPYGYIDLYGNSTTYTWDCARTAQYWAGKLGLRGAVVLQAFAWTQYYDSSNPLCSPWPACASFPSYGQMKAQRDQALLYSSPEFILWFDYPDILSSDLPKKHWEDLVAAAFSPLPAGSGKVIPRGGNCVSGWVCEDIGCPKLEGTQAVENDVWMVEGAGWDIWSKKMVKADQFRYVWQTLKGDGEMGARVVDQTASGPGAKAGVMLRKTYDPVSPYYAVFGSPEGGLEVLWRMHFDDTPTRKTFPGLSLPVYLKIRRTGTMYGAYVSMDGIQYSLITGSTTSIQDLDGPLMAGLAVTSRNEDALSRARFEKVSVLPATK